MSIPNKRKMSAATRLVVAVIGALAVFALAGCAGGGEPDWWESEPPSLQDQVGSQEEILALYKGAIHSRKMEVAAQWQAVESALESGDVVNVGGIDVSDIELMRQAIDRLGIIDDQIDLTDEHRLLGFDDLDRRLEYGQQTIWRLGVALDQVALAVFETHDIILIGQLDFGELEAVLYRLDEAIKAMEPVLPPSNNS